MGFLAGKRSYLGGPMQYTDWDNGWREEVSAVLTNEFKIDLFDPAKDAKQQWVEQLKNAQDKRDYDEMRRIAKQFVHKDLLIVDRMDFVIASVPYKVPTIGTTHECISSDEKRKPTLLVCEQGKHLVPAWYYGIIPHRYFFGAWQDMYKYLREVDAGLHMDDDRWAFVYGLI